VPERVGNRSGGPSRGVRVRTSGGLMLFNSYAFLLIFPPAAIGICGLSDACPRARMPVLILLSLIFYGYWDVRFLPLMVGSVLINWLAIRAHIAWRSNAAIPAAIVANLAVLAFFKYLNLFTQSFSYVTSRSMSYIDVALPLGISFFTFHHIMYLIDLRRGIAPQVALERYALAEGVLRRPVHVEHHRPGERQRIEGARPVAQMMLAEQQSASPVNVAIDVRQGVGQNFPPEQIPLSQSGIAILNELNPPGAN
jgi:hypothetical protein